MKKYLKLLWLVAKRVLQELFPQIAFVVFARNFSLSKISGSITAESIISCGRLDEDNLKKRLSAEHDRASKIDDKTSKFTLGLSISLSVISALSGSLVKIIPVGDYGVYITPMFVLSSVYMLSGGLVALGALKTLPKYGYGTEFEIDSEANKYQKALRLQERINILRHLRNEASFMSLRNGFILMLAALIFCSGVLIFQFFDSSLKSTDIIYFVLK